MKHDAPAIRYASQVLFLPLLGGVIGGELGPPFGQPHIWDKLLHFGAYALLAILASLSARNIQERILGPVALILMGGCLEILQGLIGRDSSWGDEAANSLGVVAGVLCALALQWILARQTPMDANRQKG